ncbi:SLAC1 anion channel family protein [Aquirhabdus parva]|uniref:C4-dicarboxylate ABC transporter n=1 Tax=Aquirhabdus parva TaxID=2283318 RepID=A0A345P9E0_9GAMM|nr:SLAC1 anion channel family protein [Aquirhabdus parva]AXI03899.1 C4-dicarboxylate ABC transporter [Aquirhabdus parva]
MTHAQIADLPSAPSTTSIKNLPINLFAAVMGISGLVLALRQASHQFGLSPMAAESTGVVAVVVFVILSLSYIIKAMRFPAVVRGEFTHPIAGNFFGTVTIAILLISSVVAPVSTLAAEVIWTIGALAALALAFIIVSRLLQGKIDATHALPVWLIPSVGTLDIPVTGGHMSMAWAHELNLFSMAVGMVLALVFFTMITSRLIHQEKIAPPMLPSMMILMAPFPVGFLAYTHFTQHVDQFAGLLFYFGLFLFIVISVKLFKSRVPFIPGWWAISFPLAALVNAALEYATYAQTWPITLLAGALLVFLSIVIIVLAVKTLQILANGKLLSA